MTKHKPEEFQENVMHILDRSHVKYRLQLDNSYVVDSQSAIKGLKSYSPETKAGVIPLKSKETMLNRVTLAASRSQSRRKSNRNNVAAIREMKTESKKD